MLNLSNRASSKDVASLTFHDSNFTKWQALQASLREVGVSGAFKLGIVAEPYESEFGHKSMVHFANPYEDLTIDNDGKLSGDKEAPLMIQSLPSYSTVEEVEAIKAQTVAMPETCEMLFALAQARAISNMLLLEGDTAIGKTFTIELFTKILYGPSVSPFDFYCNGQTDVSDLLGTWTPKTSNAEDREKWNRFIASEEGLKRFEELVDAPGLPEGRDLTDRQRALSHHLQELAKSIGLSSGAQWSFTPGALGMCYEGKFDPESRSLVSASGGNGFVLHVQEIGRARAIVANALLETRGKNGRMNDSLQLWRNGGQKLTRGSDALIVISNNPEEDSSFQGINSLDKALLRGLMSVKFLEGLSPYSLAMASDQYFRYERSNTPEHKPFNCLLELYNYPDDIGRMLGSVMSVFHGKFTKALSSSAGSRSKDLVVPS
ncbi:MAG: hypothetical protein KDD62_08775, partial [Bdellovibrionales bacterium]|nr:hypothetical protein [Bdellovibrionales bacterium]